MRRLPHPSQPCGSSRCGGGSEGGPCMLFLFSLSHHRSSWPLVEGCGGSEAAAAQGVRRSLHAMRVPHLRLRGARAGRRGARPTPQPPPHLRPHGAAWLITAPCRIGNASWPASALAAGLPCTAPLCVQCIGNCGCSLFQLRCPAERAGGRSDFAAAPSRTLLSAGKPPVAKAANPGV